MDLRRVLFISIFGVSATTVFAQSKIRFVWIRPVASKEVSTTDYNRLITQLEGLFIGEESFEMVTVSETPKESEEPKAQKPKIIPEIEKAITLLDKGKELLRKRRYERAVRVLYRTVQLLKRKLAYLEDFEVFVDAQLNLAVAFIMADYREEGIATLRQVITLRPDRIIDKKAYPPRFVQLYERYQERIASRKGGDIKIVPIPSDAEVYCDGKLVGKGENTISGLVRGRHYIRLVAPGFMPRSVAVYTPAPGKTRSLTLRLRPERKKVKKVVTRTPQELQEALKTFVRQGDFGSAAKRAAAALLKAMKAQYLVTGYIVHGTDGFHFTLFVYSRKTNAFYTVAPSVIDDEMQHIIYVEISMKDALVAFFESPRKGKRITGKPGIYSVVPTKLYGVAPPPIAPIVPVQKPAPAPTPPTTPSPPPAPKPTPKSTVTPPPAPQPQVSVEELPPDFPILEEKHKKKWYEKWWVWTLIGVGVIGAGVGTYFGIKGGPSSEGVGAHIEWRPY